MPNYSNYNIVSRLQKWMDSVAGQTFMNYAYSWGASVVILGTLFKLTHLPGANLMLFIGMGTEVVVFFISAFDRPFDKTQEGLELNDSDGAESRAGATIIGGGSTVIGGVGVAGEGTSTGEGSGGGTVIAGGGGSIGGGTVIAGGGGSIGGGTVIAGGGGGIGGGTVIAGGTAGEGTAGEGMAAAGTSTGGGAFIVGGINGPTTPAPAVTQETAEAMEEATTTYVSRLNELNDLLLKVAAQSERLTTDSEEMENLNRTLTGIAKVYEMQLKGASQQIGTIDEINAKTRKMVEQIEALNKVYARMIEAMTTNMNLSGTRP